MYKNRNSMAAPDFLYRLQYVIDHPIENLQRDFGSEFAHYFERAASKLNIERYLSRVRTPEDNPEVERFHETLEQEWLYEGNLILDCVEFSKDLTRWLIECNFNRPHKALDYLTPIEYIERELIRIRGPSGVLPNVASPQEELTKFWIWNILI